MGYNSTEATNGEAATLSKQIRAGRCVLREASGRVQPQPAARDREIFPAAYARPSHDRNRGGRCLASRVLRIYTLARNSTKPASVHFGRHDQRGRQPGYSKLVRNDQPGCGNLANRRPPFSALPTVGMAAPTQPPAPRLGPLLRGIANGRGRQLRRPTRRTMEC